MAAVSTMADEGWDLPEWSPDTFDLAAELRVNERLQQEDLDELAEWAARQRALPALRGALAVSLRCLTPKAQSALSGRNSNPQVATNAVLSQLSCCRGRPGQVPAQLQLRRGRRQAVCQLLLQDPLRNTADL